MNNQVTDLVIRMNLTAWEQQNKRFGELIATLSDDELRKEASPGRNTGTYLLGHITAASDGMFTLMGLQGKMYPELEDVFLKSPDGSGKAMPPISDLRACYHAVTDALNAHFSKMTSADWLSRHTAVSEEDFVKEPMRNKLNIVISRTIHLASHMGQMLYLRA